MSPTYYLKAIRRRWADVVLAVGVALLVGLLLSRAAPSGPVERSYEATSVLLATGDFYSAGVGNLTALAALTTVGEVPERVAERVGHQGSPLNLAAQVEATVEKEAGILRITARSTDPGEARTLSRAFAEELTAFLQETRSGSIADQTEALLDRLDRIEASIGEKDREIARATPAETGTLQAERDALVRQYGLLYESYQQVANTNANPGGLEIVQQGVAIPVDTGGIRPPESLVARLLLAAFLGLISGTVIVLVIDRFDTRIRTRKSAEEHFGSPVLAEVPLLSRRKQQRSGLALDQQPRSPAADSFRMLATMLSMPSPSVASSNGPVLEPLEPNGRGAPGPSSPTPAESARGPRRSPPKTILVTSPGPSEGKTTVAANLALAFAQQGEKVLVLSCDLRRPRIHRLLGVGNERGFGEQLEARPDGPILKDYIRNTRFASVWLAPSGPPPSGPGQLLASPEMRRGLAEARAMADVTVIDTAPILTTSDAANLVPHVDAVVLVGRAGRTTQEVARQTTELIDRLGGRIRGVVLNATVEFSVPRRYYSYRYYRTQRPNGKGSPRLARHSQRA